MSRGLRPEELRLWAVVAATVRPAAGRAAPVPPPAPDVPASTSPPLRPAEPAPRRKAPAPPNAPLEIEPGRRRRLARERDPITFRLDLHGLDQDRARAALIRFLLRAQAEGERAVLVITGKGTRGDGALRRHAPEWLADPALSEAVAGVSPAHRRHGGEGALYVALKRRRAD